MKTLFQIYRCLLSPLWASFGGGCRFAPSCSHYSEAAIREFGWAKGTCLTLWRLLRCHPLTPGGYDPVPPVSMRSR